VHKTQNEDKQNKKKNNTRKKTKKMSPINPAKNRGWRQMLEKDTQFLPVMRRPPCSRRTPLLKNKTNTKNMSSSTNNWG
jgi:hypothetical protein